MGHTTDHRGRGRGGTPLPILRGLRAVGCTRERLSEAVIQGAEPKHGVEVGGDEVAGAVELPDVGLDLGELVGGEGVPVLGLVELRLEVFERGDQRIKIKGKMGVKWDSRDGLDGHQPTASRYDFYL